MSRRPTFSANEDPLASLVTLSRYCGGDPEIVLAGGGNSSLKDAETLHIKASGTAMATIDADGFVELKRQNLEDLLHETPPADVTTREAVFKERVMAARAHPERGRRPSVESVLHHLVPGRFVFHGHPTRVNVVTCCADGERIAAELFGDDVVWMPYCDPGWTLSRGLQEALAAWRQRTGRERPAAVLMQNHGIIVSGDDPADIPERLDRIIDGITEKLPPAEPSSVYGEPRAAEDIDGLLCAIAPALRALLAEDPRRLPVVVFDDSPLAVALAAGKRGRDFAAGCALSPDQVVYCKNRPLWFSPPADRAAIVASLKKNVDEYRAANGFPPVVTVVEGAGILAAGGTPATAKTAADVYRDALAIIAGAEALGGVKPLPERDAKFIEDWEVERYRRTVAAGGRAPGRLDGTVALVTGAAQGFGRAIARLVAAEGAHVVLADINAAGAEEAAAEICGQLGAGRATGLAMDVTDAQSVAAAVRDTVRTYGGLDLLVSNAGVLKAGSVTEMTEADFRFVTDVNYTGYFLCVRAAAPVMAAQHAARPDCMTDIVQINSKSGLAGSNRNAAYAGSKFGGLGLTQSFALELIEDGIKVNAVCPGNFYDGPLWSDPEHGLFVQYLNTGKVPGAKTIEDVRKVYEAKSPIHRGCTAEDVVKALLYLVDQTFETGQALPVTGGQEMLR